MSEEIEQQISVKRQPETRGAKARSVTSLDASVLGDVDVQLTAILGRGMLTVKQLLDLAAGSIVELGTPLDGMVEISLNDRLIARGEIVAVEDRFGVRITQVVAEQP